MLNVLRKIIPRFLLNWHHFLWAFFGALVYRFSAQGMIVIGVTGTNGKSTTVDMISRIFREAGFSVASLSSIRFQIKEKEWRNTMKMTMPGRFVIQRFLRQAKNAGCTHVVLEVTSEGMLQHRHRFIPFHTAVFTNLSPEHIERHGSFEKYKQTKGKLFALARKVHVINADDEHAPYFLQFPAKQKYLYGTKSAETPPLRSSRVFAENIVEDRKGLRFSVGRFEFHIKLLGGFNAYNALAAIAVAQSQDIALATCKKALEKMQVVPGRMEKVISSPFLVVVDYAFTPAALEKVYQTLRSQLSIVKSQRLICVLSAAGGGRDSWKRPVLGRIAAMHCDVVFVTNEDPYEEDPQQIIDQVARGAYKLQTTNYKLQKLLDRREAIRAALQRATPGDVVVITGKGSEDSMAVAGGKRIPFDDREVVGQEWTKLKERGMFEKLNQ